MNVTVIASLISGATAIASEYIRHKKPATNAVDLSSDRLYQFIEDEEAKEKESPQITVDAPKTRQRINVRVEQSISDDRQIEPEPQGSPPLELEPAPEDRQVINIRRDNVFHEPQSEPAPGKAASIVSGCIPCSLGHVGTCSGLMKEAVRFANTPEGVGSPEVIDRVNMCLDELNTMERVDMSPSMIQQLSPWEKALAHDVLAASRATRHELEDVSNLERLEEIAANTENKRKEIGRKWFQQKLANLSDQDKANIQQRIIEKLNALKSDETESEPVPEATEGFGNEELSTTEE